MNWHTLIDIAPYDWSAIGTAVFCAAIIGLERQLRGKPVGIRTSALITLGTYLFLWSGGWCDLCGNNLGAGRYRSDDF